MDVGQARLIRNGLGSLAVLALIAMISLGLPALDRVLPDSRPLRPGQPYEVGGGISVVPPPGSVVDLNHTRPRNTHGTALFRVGTIRYVIVVAPFTGRLAEAAERLRRKITSNRGYQVTHGEVGIITAGGLVGRQGVYAAAGRSGRYAVFIIDGLVIEVTVSGSDPQLRAALRDIQASTRSITYRKPN